MPALHFIWVGYYSDSCGFQVRGIGKSTDCIQPRLVNENELELGMPLMPISRALISVRDR